MKRFIVDWLGNYMFFVPLVLLGNRGWNWPNEVVLGYLISSIWLAAIGGRLYTWFLEHLWYPLWRLS